MKPGTRVRFNQTCAWPERDGCEGVVVDPAVFNGTYPADKRSKEVLVLLDADPLSAAGYVVDDRTRGWTCRTPVSALDVVSKSEVGDGQR